MAKLSEADLKGIIWNDFSIQKQGEGSSLLILICEKKEQASRLYNIISHYPYDIEIYIDKDKKFVLRFDFLDSEYGIGFNTGQNIKTYPPLQWLIDRKVKFITAGIWVDDGKSWNIVPYLNLESDIKMN